MADTITSPNMNLPVPIVGTAPGPNYATDLDSCMTLIDRHDHTPGNGVAITPQGMDINTDLDFEGNFALNTAGLGMEAQVSTPANGFVYISGVDLYFTDLNGNNIRMTQTGAVAGTPGSITNLLAPASASYVSASKSFVWQSNTNIAANLDAASLLMRNISPNSTFALTLSPPNALSSNFTLTLPVITAPLVGGQPNIMTMDGSGNMAAVTSIDNSTIVISSNLLKVPTGGITGLQLSHVNQTTTITANGTFTVPAGVYEITVLACGGGGGGGGGGSEGGSGAAGGSGSVPQYAKFAVTPGDTITLVVGAGGSQGSGGTSGGAGGAGGQGGSTTITDTTTSTLLMTVTGGAGGAAGNVIDSAGGAAGTTGYLGTRTQTGGGGGGATGPSTSAPGSTGTASSWATAGTGGAASPNPGSFVSGGGGGGAAALGAGANGGNAGQTSGANGIAGSNAAANSGAGGGGGGGAAGGGVNTGGHGGTGGTGVVVISWIGHS